jgi:enoyl-CoA hydratase/carnithine racemase
MKYSEEAMKFKTILYEVSNRVATIQLNRPERINALSIDLCAEFQQAVKGADADPGVRVLIVRGSGTKAFSAGYDIQESAKAPKRGLVEWRRKLEEDLTFTYAPWNCSKPVIAMIFGHCLGGGLELALMCDARYAAANSRFGVVETRFAAGVATCAMPWIVGARSRRLIYTGDVIDAKEALSIGLIDAIHPVDSLEVETAKMAGRMSRVALEALQWNKRVLNRTSEIMGFDNALKYGLEACAMLDSTETEEGTKFNDLRRSQGLGEALKWQRSLFSEFE